GARYIGATFDSNQYATCSLTVTGTVGTGSGMGMELRASSSVRSMYRFTIDHAASNNAQWFRFINGTGTRIDQWTQAFTDADTFTVAVEGETLYTYDKTGALV